MFASVWQLVTTVFFLCTLVKLVYKLVNDAKFASARGATESQRRRHAHQQPPTRPQAARQQQQQADEARNEVTAAAAASRIAQPAEGAPGASGSANQHQGQDQDQDQDDDEELEFLETLQFVISQATSSTSASSSGPHAQTGSGSRFLTPEQREEEQRELESRRLARQLYRRQLHPRSEGTGEHQLPVDQEPTEGGPEFEADSSEPEPEVAGDVSAAEQFEDCRSEQSTTSGFRIDIDTDEEQVIEQVNDCVTRREQPNLTKEIKRIFSGEEDQASGSRQSGRHLRLILLIAESFLFEPLQTSLGLVALSFAFVCKVLDCIGGVEASAEAEVQWTGSGSSRRSKQVETSLPESSTGANGGSGASRDSSGWSHNWRSNYFHRRYFSRRSLSAALLSDDDDDDDELDEQTTSGNYVTTTTTN